MPPGQPQDPDVPSISTPRLELVSMSVPFMEALAARDLEAAEREIGATVTPWLAEELQDFLRYRLAQLAAESSIRRWLGRAIVLTDDDGKRHVIGSIGFHGPPDPKGRLEVGYSIDPGYRRRGYAIEAVRALLDWAAAQGIRRFIASVSPDNAASRGLIDQLGFVQTGSHIDEIDGLELEFEADWPPLG
jgi:RimJ/RimL family protein N-acetyltransferase